VIAVVVRRISTIVSMWIPVAAIIIPVMTDGLLTGEFIECLRGARVVRSPPAPRHRQPGNQGDLHLSATLHTVVSILFDRECFMIKIFLLLVIAACAPAATPVIIDTDMGSDDVMAIALLLSHPEIPIEAITVVNGLAHVPAGAANARPASRDGRRSSEPPRVRRLRRTRSSFEGLPDLHGSTQSTGRWRSSFSQVGSPCLVGLCPVLSRRCSSFRLP